MRENLRTMTYILARVCQISSKPYPLAFCHKVYKPPLVAGQICIFSCHCPWSLSNGQQACSSQFDSVERGLISNDDDVLVNESINQSINQSISQCDKFLTAHYWNDFFKELSVMSIRNPISFPMFGHEREIFPRKSTDATKVPSLDL